jgi:hypothetical protein
LSYFPHFGVLYQVPTLLSNLKETSEYSASASCLHLKKVSRVSANFCFSGFGTETLTLIESESTGRRNIAGRVFWVCQPDLPVNLPRAVKSQSGLPDGLF